MNKEQADQFASDLTKAIGFVMAKHGFSGALIEIGGNKESGELLVSLKPTTAQKQAISANAMKRYQDYGPQLGLPAPGTEVTVGHMSLTLLGLSTDRKRVKALGSNERCHEIPVEVAKALAEASTAMKVDQMEAKEEAAGDTVDPLTAELLAKVMGGK